MRALGPLVVVGPRSTVVVVGPRSTVVVVGPRSTVVVVGPRSTVVVVGPRSTVVVVGPRSTVVVVGPRSTVVVVGPRSQSSVPAHLPDLRCRLMIVRAAEAYWAPLVGAHKATGRAATSARARSLEQHVQVATLREVGLVSMSGGERVDVRALEAKGPQTAAHFRVPVVHRSLVPKRQLRAVSPRQSWSSEGGVPPQRRGGLWTAGEAAPELPKQIDPSGGPGPSG